MLAIDSLPRTLSRAQKMDALTSMAGVAGYRAVIEAANAFGRFFNGQITAAGKIPPAKVFIAGAGVAGLAAIGTAASLGAIVRANDTRAEVADQVVSLGGEFVKVDYEEEGSGGGGYAKVMSEGFQKAQREMYAKQAQGGGHHHHHRADPGQARAQADHRRDGARRMKPGSVIVDMAAEQGGNCELTEPGQAVVKHGVTIVGYTDLAQPAGQAVVDAVRDQPVPRLTEELCKTKDGGHQRQHGRRGHPRPDGHQGGQHHLAAAAAQAAGRRAAAKPAAAPADRAQGHGHGAAHRRRPSRTAIVFGVARAAVLVRRRCTRRRRSSRHFTVFVLACFVGYMVVWNVTPALHTPLMSVTNAISSIIAIGALVQVAPPLDAAPARTGPTRWILGLAVVAHRAHRDQHVRRLRRHAAHAGDVPQVRRRHHVRKPRNRLLHRRDDPVHPEPRRALQSGDLAARQPVRHHRHGHRRAGHRVRAARHRGRLCRGSSARWWSAAPSACTPRAIVQMTQMPELVALMHSLVGLAACLVGFASYIDPAPRWNSPAPRRSIHEMEIYIGILIGAVTFSGSVIAFGKLSGKIGGKPLLLPGRHWLNLAGLLVVIWFGREFLHAEIDRRRA